MAPDNHSTRRLRTLLGSACLYSLALACEGDGATIITNGGTGGQTGNVGGSGADENGGSGGGSGSGGSAGEAGSAGASGEGGTGGSTAAACPTHPNVTENSGRCEISSSLAAPVTQNLTLDPDRVWLMTGPVIIGDDAAETVLTVEAGTTVFGNDQSFILIQRFSKIIAEGTADAPIVFTSSVAEGSRGTQDWGGLVINGRAPINVADNADGSAPGEADTGRYGGDVADDDSGVLRYVRIEFAGKDIDPENELNGIAFQGVGSGTDVEFVQVHMTQDDAIEFFGGTVNVKHLVLTGCNDDSVDWTDGWAGKAQFIVAEELAASGTLSSDPRGIEGDNEEDNNSAEPYSSPILSNLTLIGRSGNAFEAMRLRRGTRGQVWNTVLSGWGPCLQVSEDQTIANVNDDTLQVNNLVFNCASSVGGADAALTAGEALVADGNVLTTPALLDGWQPGEGSSALAIGAGPTDEFFDTVDYAGAFDGTTDWTAGWIETATR